LGTVVLFHAEVADDRFGRPDLEGWDDRGRPLVVIEAKFGARLEGAQVKAYMINQVARLDGGAAGALVVLVPPYRRAEADAVLSSVGSDAGGPTGVPPTLSTAVLTWDELLGVWDKTAAALPPEEREAVVCDLRQFRELCRTMIGLDIPPLGPVATGGAGWQDREDDLRRLVDEATARYRAPGSRLLPIGLERWSGFEYYRRYINGLPGATCDAAVGVVAGLADQRTPFWMRYQRTYCEASFQIISERIMASQFAGDARAGAGHDVWLPLHVSADRNGAAIVDELVERIDEIRAVASGAGSA
jgi:hypothetical protein